MANKNAHLRPHCVDLSPSIFTGKNNADKSGGPSAGIAKKHQAGRPPQQALPAGAIRRSTEPKDKFGSSHIGKLSAAAVVAAGVAVWTSSSSEPFTPVTYNTEKPTLRASVSAPAFFFDDESDALERNKNLPAESGLPVDAHIAQDTGNGNTAPPLESDAPLLFHETKVAMLTAQPKLAAQDSSAAVLDSPASEKAAPKPPTAPEATTRVAAKSLDRTHGDVIAPDPTPASQGPTKISRMPAPISLNPRPAAIAPEASTRTQPIAATMTDSVPAPSAANPLVEITADTVPNIKPSPDATTSDAKALADIRPEASELPLPSEPALAEADEPAKPTTTMKKVVVKSGDTLSDILNRHGLKGNRLRSLFTDALVIDHLSGIEVGQVIDMTFDANNELTGLTTRAGVNTRINIESSGAGFAVSAVDLPIERKEVVTAGRIEQSLYLAADKANLKQSTIMELSNIFQWELDFARDIRLDDKFSLVYEQLYREGDYVGDGNILAAEFVRGGKVYKAIRFTTDDGDSGYYSPDGQSKRRTFMRHPVDVVRITSRFNPNRLHPVLHKIRAHRGVDYGSPHGSPIYATADGRIIFSGAKNAYGNTVILKHGEKFSTLYAHMSKISSKSKEGQSVKQGDVIGYVGKTGRVTGTHLHYEFRVNGKQIDPLKVELPSAAPIDAKYLPRLQQISKEMSVKMAQAFARLDSQIAFTSDVLASPAKSQ